jgi:hypothetical protein
VGWVKSSRPESNNRFGALRMAPQLAARPSSFLTVTGQGSVDHHLPSEKQPTGSTQQGEE